MTKRTRNILIASASVAVLAASAVTFASADIAGSVPGEEAAVFAAPVTGGPLFVVATGTGDVSACMTADDVVASLKGEQAMIGGDVVMLEDGLDQDFADAWRGEAGGAEAKVSNVIAHLFDDEGGHGIADVIEFDETGCAMSRTLLSGEDWVAILSIAAGAGAEA